LKSTSAPMLFTKHVAEAIDLRSDVVSKPSKEMFESMTVADLGNDGWREDPAVLRLERKIAAMLGKEAALFVPSGTMANEIALRLMAPPGTVVIVDRWSHIFNHEVCGPAVLSGLQLLPIEPRLGYLTWSEISRHIPPHSHQLPSISCISLENTLNNAGGLIYPLDQIQEIAVEANKRGIRLHMDGARLFNAVVATSIDASVYSKPFDIVNICLSKGLGCPGGSVLAGTQTEMENALQIRRQLGGSLRQIAGMMAAAGLYALKHNMTRLKQDHDHARWLADAIKRLQKLRLLAEPETNMVYFEPLDGNYLDTLEQLRNNDILVAAYNPPSLRMVTHIDVSKEMVNQATNVISEIFGES